MTECKRCGGETREGIAFITMNLPAIGSTGGGIFSMHGMNIPGVENLGEETTRTANLKWREKTGKEKGWIIKTEEEKTFNIKGRRCLECGFIDFYVAE